MLWDDTVFGIVRFPLFWMEMCIVRCVDNMPHPTQGRVQTVSKSLSLKEMVSVQPPPPTADESTI